MATAIIEDLCKLADDYSVFLISSLIDYDEEEDYDVIPPSILAYFEKHGEAETVDLIETMSKEVINDIIEIELGDDEKRRIRAKTDLVAIENTCKWYREQLI